MAKPKWQLATPANDIVKENSNGDVRPQDLNFANLSDKIRTQFQSFEADRKKKLEKTHKIQKTQKAKAEIFGNRETTKAKAPIPISVPRGKKRGLDGEVLPKNRDSKARSDEDGRKREISALQEEIFALGGTAEDISLFDGVLSESEVGDEGVEEDLIEDGAQRHIGLQKGLTNIFKEIALVQGAANPVEDSASASEEDASVDDVTLQQEHSQPSAIAPIPKDAKIPVLSRKVQIDLTFEARADWFNLPGPGVDRTKAPAFTLPRYSLDQLHGYAKTLLDAENEAYKKSQQSKSSQNFYSTVIASGTLSDKTSALTLAVQESPVHNVKALETLVALAKKRSRAQAVDVLRALKDLFAQGSLLPSERKLHNFVSNPEVLACFGKSKSWKPGDALPKDVEPRHLISWAYESWLKEVYFEVLKTLEVWCNDEIEFSKSRAISYVFELLKEKPEQEANLLRMLVNKLGDPVKKIASQTSYLIMQLMTAHPAMKGIIVSAVETELLFRPGQSLHAKYYAIVTLNQTTLSKTEDSLATKLLDVYFGLFVGLLKPAEAGKPQKVILSDANAQGLNGSHQRRKSVKKPAESGGVQEDDLRDKLTSALLTGINRAYPYTDTTQETLSRHLDALFRITHSSNFNTSIQAMLLIQQLSALDQASHDRFYRTLYESLLDARLITSSKQSLYLNLLFRSLKADVNHKRVKAFAKRITQVLTLHQPSFVCGAFFLLKELETTFPSLSGLIDQAEEQEAEEEHFQDVVESDTLVAHQVSSVNGLDHAKKKNNVYDGRKRDPEHSRAEYSCLWELLPFLAHYHPSVAVSADHLLRHAKLPGKPDLNLHTLIHFLDRFVYRNPKASSSSLRGSSIMQPLAASEASGLLLSGAPSGQQRLPVNTNNFRTQKEGDVAAEDVFFHKYFNSLGKETPKVKSKARSGESEGNAADGEESEIWKAMMESAPDLEGADNSDDDLVMEDLESDMEPSLGEESEDEDNESIDDGADHIREGSSDDLDSGLMTLDGEGSEEGRVALRGKRPAASSKSANSSKERRKRLKGLPTFASASDYAKMLEDDDGEELG